MAWPSVLARTKDWGTEILTDADLEGQFDLIINYINAMMDSSTGHKHDGTTSEGPKLTVGNLDGSADDQGEVYYSNGSAITALAVGTSGQFLQTQGAAADPQWASLTWDSLPDGSVVQVVNTTTGAVATGSTAIPFDDTIPQNTEGDEYMTLAITPKATTNKLKIEVVFYCALATAQSAAVALFQDSTAGALAVVGQEGDVDDPRVITLTHYMDAGTTSATTFKVRGGPDLSGTLTFNGAGGARKYGGKAASSITITEIKAS